MGAGVKLSWHLVACGALLFALLSLELVEALYYYLLSLLYASSPTVILAPWKIEMFEGGSFPVCRSTLVHFINEMRGSCCFAQMRRMSQTPTLDLTTILSEAVPWHNYYPQHFSGRMKHSCPVRRTRNSIHTTCAESKASTANQQPLGHRFSAFQNAIFCCLILFFDA